MEQLSDYAVSLLIMIRKFGPAISSASVENREEALQELVVAGYATMMRDEAGHIMYAITREGREFLEEVEEPEEKK